MLSWRDYLECIFNLHQYIIIMFNVISDKAEILASLVFAVRAGIKGLTAISFPGYLTR